MRKCWTTLFCGVSTIALIAGSAAGTALAQEPTPSAKPAAQTAPVVDQTGPSAPNAPTQLNEIVVTAQKRTERLIDVPSSVTALSSDRLQAQGALSFQDYQAYVPGLSTTTIAPGFNQLIIRGITTGNGQLSSTVSTYFDDVPTNSSNSKAEGSNLTPDPDLLDVARIEVLRGPQGTLYGANALGGVVKYVLAEPSLTEAHGQVQAGVSSVDHGDVGYVTRAAVDAPLIDGVLAVRASGFYTEDPGYIDDLSIGRSNVNGSSNWGGRLALLWKPTAHFSASLSSLYQFRNTRGLPEETDTTTTQVDGKTTLAPAAGQYDQAVPTDQFIRTAYQLHAITLNADLGFANLVSDTSFGRQKTDLAFDYSGLYGGLLVSLAPVFGVSIPDVTLPVNNNFEKFTQEVRLASPAGHFFDYLVGAYYTREYANSFSGGTGFLSTGAAAPSPFNPLLAADLKSVYEEVAVFVNGTLHLTDRFDIQGGGRWSQNDQQFTESLNGLLSAPLTGSTFSGSSDETAWTYAVSPQFKITRDWNVYARVAKGFRPGGENLVPPGEAAVSPTYGSDSLINYEVGTKAALLDRRLNVSLSGFYIDWDRIQTTASAGGFKYLVNGGKARSDGVEAEAHWSANGLTVGANLSYIDARTLDAITLVGARPGDQLPYTPHFSGAFSTDYAFPIAGDMTASVGGDVRYTGTRQAYYSQATASNPGNLRLDDYALLDLRAGLHRGRYDLTLYAENVADTRAILAAQTEPEYPEALTTIGRPRTVGLLLAAKF